jgi:hypothetical protein
MRILDYSLSNQLYWQIYVVSFAQESRGPIQNPNTIGDGLDYQMPTLKHAWLSMLLVMPKKKFDQFFFFFLILSQRTIRLRVMIDGALS